MLFYLSALLVFNVSAFSSPNRKLLVPFNIAKVVAVLIYIFVVRYFYLLDYTWTAWVEHILWFISVIWIASFFIEMSAARKETALKATLGIFAIIAVIVVNFILPFFLADAKFEATKGVESETTVLETDQTKIVSVPETYARYKATKLLGSVKNPSWYSLGDLSLQIVNDKKYYVAPIEFSEFSTYWRADKVSPGFIMVDALNENAEAEFVEVDMTYVPSAFFGKNLDRHVRSQYPSALLLESSFEVDDNKKPYYATTYGHFDVYRSIPVMDGIILVDVVSGEMKQYPLGKIPDFVEQLVPTNIAETYNTWYGKYENGLINSVWGKTNIKEPTVWSTEGDQVIGVFDQNNELHWFTDFTNPRNSSNSMVGYSLMNARTGKLTYYPSDTALITGGDAVSAANKTFVRDKFVGTQPALYNLYNSLAWFVPMVDADGLLRGYSIVNAKDPKIIGKGATKQEAFDAYKRVVRNFNKENVTPEELAQEMKNVTGVVTTKEVQTIGEETYIFVQIDKEPNKIFRFSFERLPLAMGIEKGTTIDVSYFDIQDAVVDVEEFKKVK